MTLRETIAREIEPEAFDALSPEKVASLSTMYGGTWYALWAMSCGPLFTRIQTAYDRADAILAAIREHMTSPEAVERGVRAFHEIVARDRVWKTETVVSAINAAALGEE